MHAISGRVREGNPGLYAVGFGMFFFVVWIGYPFFWDTLGYMP